MMQQLLDKDIRALLRFDEISKEEQATLLDDIGQSVLEAAIVRYLAHLNEGEAGEFETYVEENKEDEDLLALMCEQYPDFESAIALEMESFKKETEAVLKESDKDVSE